MNSKPIYAVSKSETQANRILRILFGAGSSACDICILPSGAYPDGQSLPWRGTKIPEGVVVGAIVLGAAAIIMLGGFGVFAGLGGLAAWVALPSSWKNAGRMTRRGIPGLGTKFYPTSIPEGSFLICIRARNRKAETRVKRILIEEGAKEITLP